MWALTARFVRCEAPLGLQIKQRIGIEIGAENAEPSFGDAWILEALQFVAQRAVALLRRVEIGEPLGWIRRRGGFSQSDAGIGDAGRCEDERRDVRGRDARPARLFGIGDHRRGDGRFGFGDRVWVKVGTEIARQSEGGQVEAVVAARARVVRAPPAQRSVRPSSLDPHAAHRSARRRRPRSPPRAARQSPAPSGLRRSSRATSRSSAA